MMNRLAFVRGSASGLACYGMCGSRVARARGRDASRVMEETLRGLHESRAVAIVHLPSDIETLVRLTPARLERLHHDVERREITDRATISRIAGLLLATHPRIVAAAPAYDARWLLRFALRDGGSAVVGFDAFGQGGEVDGTAVLFSGPSLVGKLVAILGNVRR